MFGGDEAAAEGIDDVFAKDGVVLAEGEEVHAVGVAGERFEALEGEVLFCVEGNGAAVGEGEGGGGVDGFQQRVHFGDGDGLRLVAEEAEEEGGVGAVAFAGGGEGAVEVAAEALDGEVGKGICEARRGPHGADGVGGRGAHPDGEEVEDGEVHWGENEGGSGRRQGEGSVSA